MRRLIFIVAILALPAPSALAPEFSSELKAETFVLRESRAVFSADGVAPNTLVTVWVEVIAGAPVTSVLLSGGGMAWREVANASAGPARIFRVFAGFGPAPGGTVTIDWGVSRGVAAVVMMIEHAGRTRVDQVVTDNWRNPAHSGPADKASLSLRMPPGQGSSYVAGVSVGGPARAVSTSNCPEIGQNNNFRFTAKVDECAGATASWRWEGRPVHWMTVGLELR